jgi:hypothetical protein
MVFIERLFRRNGRSHIFDQVNIYDWVFSDLFVVSTMHAVMRLIGQHDYTVLVQKINGKIVKGYK